MCVCVKDDNKNVYFSIYQFAKRLQCVYISLSVLVYVRIDIHRDINTVAEHTHTDTHTLAPSGSVCYGYEYQARVNALGK